MRIPSLEDILAARRRIAPYLQATPMWSYPLLNEVSGATVYVKHENAQPTGAFKVRGGINLLASMPADQRGRGVVVYSTGNHAQSIAYAARLTGASCLVVMPERASDVKAAACRALGAEVRLAGAGMTEAAAEAARLARSRGMRLVSAGDEPELVAGVATCYLEMLEAVPDLDMIIVPVGGGTGAAGACLVAQAIAPACRVIAVQAEGAPAAHDCWQSGTMVTRPIRTAAEGLATGCGFRLTQAVLRQGLDDFVLVSDAQLRTAQRLMMSHAHTLAEAAGAAGLAGALAARGRVAGRRVGVACTGANASPAEVAEILAAEPEPAQPGAVVAAGAAGPGCPA